MIAYLDKIYEQSLMHLYMLEQMPASIDAPPHPVWQAPFVFASPDEPIEQVAKRVRRAGELWLVNYDFELHQELVISHRDQPWFMAFQRGLEPDEQHMIIGPIARRVMRSTDGQPLFELPLRFRAAAVATSRELWQRIHAQSLAGTG